LTYVVLDEANGGIVRNLNHSGIGVQAVAALRQGQIVRLRFELRYPKVRIDAQGEVIWATPSGQCGIRFLGLPPRLVRQINEWIFGTLLESISLHPGWRGEFIFSGVFPGPATEQDGLMLSAQPRSAIQLAPQPSSIADSAGINPLRDLDDDDSTTSDWPFRPLSRRTLAALVDGLVITASLLLFSLVFLSLTHEVPRWPLNLATVVGIVLFVAAFYCGFFRVFAGTTLGARLAGLASEADEEEDEAQDTDRFR